MDFVNQVICVDCREVLKQIPDESIDLVLTDPPYGILDECWDINIDTLVQQTLYEFYRVLKQNTRAFISFSSERIFEFYDWVQTTRFEVGDLLIWNYRNNVKPNNLRKLKHIYEPIFVLWKGTPKPYNKFLKYGEEGFDVWVIPTPQSNFNIDTKIHPAQKPIKLVDRIIKISTNENDLILDAFLGSGTVGAASIRNNRNFIGIEISPKYCEIARKRIAKAQQSKSYKLEEYSE